MSLYTSQHWSPITLGFLHFYIVMISFPRSSLTDLVGNSRDENVKGGCSETFSIRARLLIQFPSGVIVEHHFRTNKSPAFSLASQTDSLKAETCSVIQAVQY